jgi:DDE family transposase
LRKIHASAARESTPQAIQCADRFHLLHLSDKLLVRKRAIIESIIDQLKNISPIKHSRHRSPTNFVVHLIAGLLAYRHQDKKPGLHLDQRLLLAA